MTTTAPYGDGRQLQTFPVVKVTIVHPCCRIGFGNGLGFSSNSYCQTHPFPRPICLPPPPQPLAFSVAPASGRRSDNAGGKVQTLPPAAEWHTALSGPLTLFVCLFSTCKSLGKKKEDKPRVWHIIARGGGDTFQKKNSNIS